MAKVVVAVLLIAGVVVTVASVVGSSADSDQQAQPSSVASVTIEGARPAELAKSLDVAYVVSTIGPSVVKVSVDVDGPLGLGEGVGTGVVISADGEIVTNAHVVLDAVAVRVLLPGTTEPISAEVVGTDVGNDLALLRVKSSALTVSQFAAIDSVRVGDQVVAMGFALLVTGGATVAWWWQRRDGLAAPSDRLTLVARLGLVVVVVFGLVDLLPEVREALRLI